MSSSEQTARALGEVLLTTEISGIVISPGSRNTPLALMFDAHFGDKVSMVLDERAAAFVALGMARATGRPAVLLCTSGSAGAHYLPALLEARYGRVPLIAITADRPAELQHVGAPQTISQTRFFGEHVLDALEIPAGSDTKWVRVVVAKTVARSVGSPPGPVHLNVAFREPLYEPDAEEHELTPAGPRIERGELSATTSQLSAIEQCVESAGHRGLIVCGPLAPATVNPVAFANAVNELSLQLGWPVIAEPASGLRFTAHDQSLLVSDSNALLRHPATRENLKPACVLQFGQNPTSKALSTWLGSLGETTERILIDPDGMWHDPHVSASRLMVASPIALCKSLTARLRERTGHAAWPGWTRTSY